MRYIKIGWESFMFEVCKHLQKVKYVRIGPEELTATFQLMRIYPEHKDMDEADWKKLFDLIYNQLTVSKSLHVNRKSDTILELTI